MYFEEINIGSKIEIPPVTVEKEEMIGFALKYNPAPFHADEEFASHTRAGQVTSSGLYTFLLIWAQYITQDFGGEQTLAGTGMQMEFTAPVFAGDKLHGTAVVTEKNIRNKYNGSIRICIEIFNQDNVLVLRNYTDSVISRKPEE